MADDGDAGAVPTSGSAVPTDARSGESTARRSRRAGSGPVDAPAQERESQARARNREALTTYRALSDNRSTSAEDGVSIETPTRRQLRLEQAAGPAGVRSSSAASAASAAGAGDGDSKTPAAPTVVEGPAEDEVATHRKPSSTHTASGAVVPRDAATVADDGPTDDASRSLSQLPVPGGRRDRRRQETAQNSTVVPVPSGAPDPAGDSRTITSSGAAASEASTPVPVHQVENRSVEDALAARTALAAEAGTHATSLAEKVDGNPFAVDLGVLAQQKALAERAAVLNARARRMHELAEQNRQRKPVENDPTTAHNLSIVTPADLSHSPGDASARLRAPATSHIPVILPRAPQGGPEVGRNSTVAGSPGGSNDVDGIGAAGDPGVDTGPIDARSAHGLDPLDAMTAGLGKARRLRALQYSLLGVGAAALATGIIMTVSSLNG